MNGPDPVIGLQRIPARRRSWPRRASARTRRYANVVFFNEPAAGGHFFALEQPQTLARDIRATFSQLT
jgi:hypothetical protein